MAETQSDTSSTVARRSLRHLAKEHLYVVTIAAFFIGSGGIVGLIRGCSSEHSIEATGDVFPFSYSPRYSEGVDALKKLADVPPFPPGCCYARAPVGRRGDDRYELVFPDSNKVRAIDDELLEPKLYRSFGFFEVKNTGSKVANDVTVEAGGVGECVIQGPVTDGLAKLNHPEADPNVGGAPIVKSIKLGLIRPGSAVRVAWWSMGDADRQKLDRVLVTYNDGVATPVSYPSSVTGAAAKIAWWVAHPELLAILFGIALFAIAFASGPVYRWHLRAVLLKYCKAIAPPVSDIESPST